MAADPRPRDHRLVKIQIARRDLALEDDDYRDMLERITGKRSSRGLSPAEMDRVLVELRRLGFNPQAMNGQRPGRRWRQPEPRADLRLILVLWRLLGEAGAAGRGRAALNAFIANPKFVDKWGASPTDLRFLTIERAQDVIEALKDMCRRHGVRVGQ